MCLLNEVLDTILEVRYENKYTNQDYFNLPMYDNHNNARKWNIHNIQHRRE